MGEPATPSSADGSAIRALAAAILDSVREDAAMPLGLEDCHDRPRPLYHHEDVEDLVFKLAQEICELQQTVKGLLDMASVLSSPIGSMPGAIAMAKTDIARIRKEMGMP